MQFSTLLSIYVWKMQSWGCLGCTPGRGVLWLSLDCSLWASSHILHVSWKLMIHVKQAVWIHPSRWGMQELLPRAGHRVWNPPLGTNTGPETSTCSFPRLEWQLARQGRRDLCTSNKLQGDSEPKWATEVKDKPKPSELSVVLDGKHHRDVIRQLYCSI